MKNRVFSCITAFLLAVLLALGVPFSVTASAAEPTVANLKVQQTPVNGAGQFRLDWDKVAGADSYEILRLVSDNKTEKAKVTTPYYTGTVGASDAAFFTVTALDKNGEILALSARVTVALPPNAPCNAVVADTENGRVLTWEADKYNNAVDFYRISAGDNYNAETVKPQLLLPDTLTASSVKVTAYRYICGVACYGGSIEVGIPTLVIAEDKPSKSVFLTAGVGEKIDLTDTVQPGSTLKSADEQTIKTDNLTIECLQTGEAEILAEGTNRNVHIFVRVCKAPATLTFPEEGITLGTGEQTVLSIPFESGEYSNSKTFTSSDLSVLTVNNNGTLTAVKEGNAEVTVTLYNEVHASVSVHVKPAATLLTATPSGPVVLGVGEEIPVRINTREGETFTSLRWSYDATVLSFDGKETVKALKEGNSALTAKTANGTTVSIPVTVRQAPRVLGINYSAIPSLLIGESRQLTVYTENKAGDMTITWSSSDEKVVKVVNGLVTAVGAGNATVTAKTYNGCTVSCTVHVPAPAKRLTLSCPSKTVEKGAKFQLTVTVSADSVIGILQFKSSDAGIVSIDENGKCEALKEGTVTLTVTNSYGAKAEMKISVMKAPDSVSLNKTTLKLGVGETKTLTASTGNGAGLDALEWSSSDTKVVKVLQNGVLTAQGTGTADVTVTTFNGLTAKCTVTVKNAPQTVTIDQPALSLRPGATVTLGVYVDTGAWSSALSFTSSNTAVATVTSAGKVTAVAAGTCTITAQVYNGVKNTCTVTVVNSVKSMHFAKNTLQLSIGDEVNSPALDQDGAAVPSCIYTSSDKTIAEVDTNGKIHAMKMGVCTVTATYYSGLTATVKVNVSHMDVPVVSQLPSYPTGCEGACATAILQYLGFKASLDTVMSYIPYQEIKYYNGKPYGPDINYTFAGNPKGTYTSGNPGYGIFAPGLTNSMQNAIDSTGVKKTVTNISGCSYTQLVGMLTYGHPVIVWSTYHMQVPQTVNEWYIDTTGEYFSYPRGTHVCVLCGYSDDYVYLMDPYDADIVAYSSTTFQARWNLLDRMAIVTY